MILKARRIIKEKLRAKNFRKNYKQKSEKNMGSMQKIGALRKILKVLL